ncbi:hypothetical protein BDQ12DRAFT_692033 [Crucibulum laeve]|uniref:Uncharacterized protein n=1 Tax=Crucibulum laeve TaxID=68775 RepID=A0A5C3LJ88_9AGAR|nr:hypothetical protein BDQ12DRAFT_692033 [Crucibulum laeve]
MISSSSRCPFCLRCLQQHIQLRCHKRRVRWRVNIVRCRRLLKSMDTMPNSSWSTELSIRSQLPLTPYPNPPTSLVSPKSPETPRLTASSSILPHNPPTPKSTSTSPPPAKMTPFSSHTRAQTRAVSTLAMMLTPRPSSFSSQSTSPSAPMTRLPPPWPQGEKRRPLSTSSCASTASTLRLTILDMAAKLNQTAESIYGLKWDIMRNKQEATEPAGAGGEG